MAHNVFISYAGEDGKVAEIVRRTLEDEGIKCWIAPRDVPIGTNYEDAIIDAIAGSRVMILIISENSNKSLHVKREIQNACLEDSPTQILPLRVDAVPLNKALRYYLSSLQWLDASTPPIEDHLKGLVADVRSRLSTPEQDKIESENVRASIEKLAGAATPAGVIGEKVSPPPSARSGIGGLMQQKKLLMAIAGGVVLLAAAGIFWAYKSKRQNQSAAHLIANPSPTATQATTPPANHDAGNSHEAIKLYQDMSTSEKVQFIEQRVQHLLTQLGDNPRPLELDDLSDIQDWVDDYAKRVGNNSRERGKTDPRFIFRQARRYAPTMIKTFEDRGVPPVIGLYLPAIESEYKNLCTPKDQAKGIFQLSLTTAHDYGLKEEDYCNVEKSIQAAAFYMSKLIEKWGRDSSNVTLAVFCFNRDPDAVQRDLSNVGGKDKKDRTFWMLAAQQGKLDREVREDLIYIPRFFAAAIVGENPQVFGLKLHPISTYTNEADAKEADDASVQD